MNLICTSMRASLLTETISLLLFLNLVSQPLNQFKPIPYVRSWLARGRRGAKDTRRKERKQEGSQANMVILWTFLEK
ncbi:UNVERIFIED_CONTAM: hypothetical protein FKN15_069412 [Acipenser sinensis]